MQSVAHDALDPPQRSPFLQSSFIQDANNQPFPSPPSATSPPIPIPNATSHYQYTPPSYSGSFGSNPDSNWGGRELDDPNDPFAFQDDYNPNDFDGPDASPSSFNNLQFFDSEHLQPDVIASLDVQNNSDAQYPIHLSLTPADPVHKQHYSPRPGDAPSPASSSGSGNDDRRSRASSISSVHTGHPSPAIPTFQTLSFDPELDAKQNFDVSAQAPQFSHTGPSPPSSPPAKPQSPPALVIPSDSAGSGQSSLFATLQPQPTAGGLLPGQPSIDINIVPSTPISGGVANAVPFQQVLHNLNQNTRNQTPIQGGAGGATDIGRIVQDPQPAFAPATHSSPSPRAPVLPLPHQDQSMEVDSQVWSVPRTQAPSYPPSRSQTPSHFRHPSDLSTERMTAHSLHSSPTITPAYPRGADPTLGLVNLNLGPGGVPAFQPNGSNGASTLLYPQPARSRSRSDTSLHPPSWGSGGPGLGASGLSGMGLGLSVNGPSGALHFQGTVDPSDVLPRETPLYPLSADAMHTTFKPSAYMDDSDVLLGSGMGDGMSLRRSRSQDGPRPGHQRSARSEDFTRGMYLPTEQDLWRPITTPDGSLAPSDPREPLVHGSPRRRRNSPGGSHERGASLSSSARPSPYPSPSASPLLTHEGLPYVADVGVGVSRPHVTTPATRSASGNRRKSEAAFKCPVPGCGSTFTRHFNLKGHLRSHNEERPFKCKWPGCEKGFARQHDCKRHEALHLNIRPYTCEGCGKTFARMDALNRHRGVECRRLNGNGDGDDQSALEMDGNQDDDAWQGSSGRGGGLVL